MKYTAFSYYFNFFLYALDILWDVINIFSKPRGR